jgi:hypothetical protein
VPISASQVYPHGGKMELFDFTGKNNDFKSIGTMDYERGDVVHDVAYRAYLKVMEYRKQKAPLTPPPPTDIRLTFPPST